MKENNASIFTVLLILVVAIMITGCSTTSQVMIDPVADGDQQVTFSQGYMTLASDKGHRLAVSIIDYSENEMVIGVSLLNNGEQPLHFSERNITGTLIRSTQHWSAKVYPYPEIAGQYSGGANYAFQMAELGMAVLGIGARFVPFGSIAMSAGKMLYSLSRSAPQSNRKRMDQALEKWIQSYLREHTVMPGDRSGGVVKIGFDDHFEIGDTIQFQVSADDEVKMFQFLCKTEGYQVQREGLFQ